MRHAATEAVVLERVSEDHPLPSAGSGDSREGIAGPDRLSAFLRADEPAEALVAWFGADRLADLADQPGRLARALDHAVAEIDREMNHQVNAVIHHPRFRRLEGSWLGLHYLVEQADGHERVKIRMLQLPWHELCRDLERASEFDQSQLFGKIYSEEFGMPGGEPFGAILGDYEVQHRPTADHPTDDVAALKAASQVAAAAFAPFIVAASPALFGLDGFRELSAPLDLAAIFGQPEYQRWSSLRQTEDARFVGIVLPRLLMRPPYPDNGTRADGFRFAEEIAADASGHVWGTAVYAFGAVLVRAFVEHGWFANIRGAPLDEIGGGMAMGLPAVDFATDAPGIARRIATEAAITDGQDGALADLGFVPLSPMRFTEGCAFQGSSSLARPGNFRSPIAQMNARLSAMLQYILCVSRFAHFLKVIVRDKVGVFQTPAECQDALQRWLLGYCLGNDGASMEQKARYPLREGRVEVGETPGNPGVFTCTIHLRPHFQLDHIVSSFRLVTKLSNQVAA